MQKFPRMKKRQISTKMRKTGSTVISWCPLSVTQLCTQSSTTEQSSPPPPPPHTHNSNCSFVILFGFLTSSSTTRLYRRRAARQSVWQFYVLPLMRQSWETKTSVSAGHIILTPTQPVGSRRPQRESNTGPPSPSPALPVPLLTYISKNNSLKKKRN